LLARYLGQDYPSEYQVEVSIRADPSQVIYRSDSRQGVSIARDAAVSVTLFDVMPQRPGGFGPGQGRPRRGGPDLEAGRTLAGPGDTGRGRWLLAVRPQAGSLEAVVAQARRRNLAVSGGLLLLLLATGVALLRFSRQAQRLAELEMEFVAGISHELRTPLTVIRTAAYNLRRKIAANPTQVERYGALIQQESEKLTAIVEQVLRFTGSKKGHILGERKPVDVGSLIDQSLQSSRGVLEETLCQVEKQIEPNLPPILGDATALQHVIQNLIGNAVKYGMDSARWIGIFARAVSSPPGQAVEIQVADRGPGIPSEEQKHVFDAFFRGKQAVLGQIHGTGLGLNLVKKIVEAHGGTIHVQSQPGAGTSFIVRIPVGPAEHQDEHENSAG
jgi:signal transduction histidine kinase